ncbi:MAG: S1 RNA-binding domain-containing protein, partial [Acutalibacteraceae bacterium]|nr:S1 RNA-binding domain-containing protein [Acutalibacteraceae bacterium]
MQLTVGQIVEGKITGITNFGVFIDLGEGKSGLVHISEV